jgi:hypothetical protein
MTIATEITTRELTFDELNDVSGGKGCTVQGALAGIASTFNIGASAFVAVGLLTGAGAAALSEM